MNAETRLQYEARVRPRQAILAAVAGVFVVAAAVLQVIGPHAKVEELTLDLITANKRVPLDQVGAVLNAIGLLAVGATLVFLYESVRARNPRAQPLIRHLAIAGAVLAAISGVVDYVLIGVKAHQFVSQGNQTYQEANHLTSGGAFTSAQLAGQLAALLLTAAFVLCSLNALRVGLLTRFMGYLGIFVGVLVLFPIGSPVPVVEAFWLIALAYLFSGRWPSGVPPAWRTGRAEPWPSGQQQREERIRAAGGSRGRGQPRGRAAPAPAAAPASSPPGRTRSGTPKRKRKRRK